MTHIIATADAREKFLELIDLVTHNKERVVLTRRGKEIAAIVPIEDLQLLNESENNHDLQEATDALKEARGAGVITLEQLKKEDTGS